MAAFRQRVEPIGIDLIGNGIDKTGERAQDFVFGNIVPY